MSANKSPREVQRVRSIFLSDSHLGFRFARADALLDFLRRYHVDNLYLVGDFFDGWRLGRNWYWPTTYDEIVDHILGLVRSGVDVRYTPGNHDDFLRDEIPYIAGVQIQDHFQHETVDGRRFCVTHGDLFDSVEQKLHRLSRFGGLIYEGLTWLNYGTNWLLQRVGIGQWNYCFLLKRLSKRIVGALNDFEHRLTEFAQSQSCEGVICGHIHAPRMVLNDGFVYCNTGDWVEHCSAMIEETDGTLRLLDGDRTLVTLSPVRQFSEPPTTRSESAGAAAPLYQSGN